MTGAEVALPRSHVVQACPLPMEPHQPSQVRRPCQARNRGPSQP